MKIGKNFWKHKLMAFLISLNYIFGLFIFLYSVTQNKYVVYTAMMLTQVTIIAIGFYSFLKAKIYRKKISLYFYMFIIIILIYSLIGFLNGADLNSLLREVAYFLNPLAFFSIGYLLATKYELNFILKILFISSFIIVSFGIIETLFLPDSFFEKFYNTAKFYTDVIPIQEIDDSNIFYSGSLSKPEFINAGINHRLMSFFGEPASAGVFLGFMMLITLYFMLYYNIKEIKLFFLFLLLLIGSILTQSRVAFIIFLSGLLPIFLNFNNRKVVLYFYPFLLFSFVLLLIFYYNIDLFMLYIEHMLSSLGHEGGQEHKEPVMYFFSKLTDLDYFFGKGFAFEKIADVGWGLIYYRTGYFGLFTYGLFLFKIFTEVIKIKNSFLRNISLSILCFTIVINFFNIYLASFKAYGIIWILVGYSYYYSLNSQKNPSQTRRFRENPY